MLLRWLTLVALLGLVVALSGCSYQTDFVVVNDSESPIQVRYKVKNYPGPFSPREPPSVVGASDLNPKGTQEWARLSSDRFQLDEVNRTVTVTVSPHEAFLVTSMPGYSGHDDQGDAQEFPVEEVLVSGARGQIDLVGQQARTSFSEVSRALYTLTYQ